MTAVVAVVISKVQDIQLHRRL